MLSPGATIWEIGSGLYDLAADQAAWSQATFGTDAERDGVGALKHLAKEAEEAEIAAVAVRAVKSVNCEPCATAENLRTELADCLLLILDASRRSGVNPLELIKAAQAKMVINKARQWPTPQTDTPVEHVRT